MKTAVLLLAVLIACGTSGPNAVAQTEGDVPELSSILSLFSAHATEENGVRLNWSLEQQSPTIVKFRLYRGYEEVGNFAVLAEVDARAMANAVEYSFGDTTARPQVTYYYKVAAVGQRNESVFPVVISATPGVRAFKGSDLEPVAVLADSKILLYVRRAGKVKLEIAGGKTLVNEPLKPGIYEFDPPADKSGTGFILRVAHESGFRKEVRWPLK